MIRFDNIIFQANIIKLKEAVITDIYFWQSIYHFCLLFLVQFFNFAVDFF